MFAQESVMEIMEDSKSFEILRSAFEQQLINDGFVEHSGYSLEKNHINAYIDERVECAWFACLQGYRLAKAQAVPEGFVLVKMDDLELLRDSALKIKYASLSNDSDRIFSDIEDIQLSVERLIELQEPAND